MDEIPEMFKSRCIDCVYYARTWNSFEFGKCCDKLEEQALVLMVDNGLSTRQYQRILQHAENLNCKLYPSYQKVKEAKQILIISDRYIASLRAAPKSKKRKMDREMKKLLELSLSDEEDSVIVSEDSSEESSTSE
ncbi:hypothetical protein AVEN_232541-1 [Araneus ventricosus]|uniref:Uncharacterized protein n=1 Tax=Araneus ventricosus TaxID=182803 RepID=A0A4Y2KNE9_ARAVE|nr:hypothetical protein AVEN_232541-1 [Araneus ventricosus]